MRPRDVDARSVYDVLVQYAGAPVSRRDAFRASWPVCGEWRFQGALGFGGKVWYNDGSVFVSCYREDMTTERRAIVDHTNAALGALLADTTGEVTA